MRYGFKGIISRETRKEYRKQRRDCKERKAYAAMKTNRDPYDRRCFRRVCDPFHFVQHRRAHDHLAYHRPGSRKYACNQRGLRLEGPAELALEGQNSKGNRSAFFYNQSNGWLAQCLIRWQILDLRASVFTRIHENVHTALVSHNVQPITSSQPTAQ